MIKARYRSRLALAEVWFDRDIDSDTALDKVMDGSVWQPSQADSPSRVVVRRSDKSRMVELRP